MDQIQSRKSKYIPDNTKVVGRILDMYSYMWVNFCTCTHQV
jgi:hypothetical protein